MQMYVLITVFVKYRRYLKTLHFANKVLVESAEPAWRKNNVEQERLLENGSSGSRKPRISAIKRALGFIVCQTRVARVSASAAAGEFYSAAMSKRTSSDSEVGRCELKPVLLKLESACLQRLKLKCIHIHQYSYLYMRQLFSSLAFDFNLRP